MRKRNAEENDVCGGYIWSFGGVLDCELGPSLLPSKGRKLPDNLIWNDMLLCLSYFKAEKAFILWSKSSDLRRLTVRLFPIDISISIKFNVERIWTCIAFFREFHKINDGTKKYHMQNLSTIRTVATSH